MQVLLTGGSGFLGRAIDHQLSQKGWKVFNLGRAASNEIVCDLSNQSPDLSSLNGDLLVIHAAGKAHVVPKTAEESALFHQVNVEGTEHLLKGLDQKKPAGFVFISSVAVYGLENGSLIKEDDPLKGDSPYAKSKIDAEAMVSKWCAEKNVPCLILRLPLVVGAKPPGNLGKMINGIKKGTYFGIGKSAARRSMVLADDVSKLIGEKYSFTGTYNLTDGVHPSFRDMEKVISTQLGKSLPFSIPMIVARFLGAVGNIIPGSPVNSATISKMTNDLTFDDSKAKKELGWKPKSVTEHFIIA